MKIFALLSLMLSFPAFAASTHWQDLSTGDSVALTQNLALDLKTGGKVRIGKDSRYVLDSVEPLEGLGVVDLVFQAKVCKHPDVASDLTLVLPAESAADPKAEVGVYFGRECALEVLVEAKDYGKPSFFRN